ncbi:unnamed protein product [Cylicocyclus nassatus]|uniref:WD repeat-containing protein 35 n=1 Tax=Cylicocyclus nassatus TaxID=53992 RepID=A0AA36MG68_CYLNA|nr:unnamed protein product [Cylicocyclus nassatus]
MKLETKALWLDGQVIVGTMDGNRIWNKELSANVAACEWSPNGNLLLFGMADGEVHTYDAQGTFIEKLHMVALENVELETALAKDLRKDNIIALKWFAPVQKSRIADNDSPVMPRLPRYQSLDLPFVSDQRPDQKPKLLIAYAHGVVQLMRNENDVSPIVARFPQLTMTCARWCPNGNFFAVTGQQLDMPVQESFVVHVVTAYGVKLSSLKLHTSSLTGCSWDPTGVKLALSAENLIWFANVRPRYKWGYCGNTVVYSYERAERGDYRVVFYETKLDESYSKPVRQLEQIAASNDYCVIASHPEDSMGKCLLQLCNNIGTCIDLKYVEVDPVSVSLNNWVAVVAGGDSYFIWHFSVPHKTALPRQAGHTNEDRVHKLDDAALAKDVIGRRKYCDSGNVYKVSLHDGSIQERYIFIPNVTKMELNTSCKKLAAVDTNNLLQVFEVGENAFDKISGMDVREVADFKWDEEQDDSIAYLSKQKLVVLRGKEAEEGITCEGYICSFRGLVVRTVLLDNFLLHKAKADGRFIIDVEIKSLRDAKQLLERLKIEEATEFIGKNPHPRLWSLLAEVALLKVDIPTAEYAYVADYASARGLWRFRDLAIAMHKKTEEWLRVLRLTSTIQGGSSDKGKTEALLKVADYHRDRQRWKEAADHYALAKKLEELVVCYIHLDDFASLENLARQLPDNHPLLATIAELFASSGLCEQAVQCFLRCDQVSNALQTCIQLNNWDKMAEDERKKAAPCLRLKKMYILAALLIEEYHQNYKERLSKEQGEGGSKTTAVLNELLEEDDNLSMEDSRMIDNAWKAAQAYHFLMLAQRQLYEGNHAAAMKTSLYLTEFEAYIDPMEIYSLLALSSCACRNFSICSRAFMKLESLTDPQSEERKRYQKLALQLFRRFPPTEPQAKLVNCTGCDKSVADYEHSCSHCNTKFPVCIVSGRPMFAYQFWLCPTCKQRAYEEEIRNHKFCPLCHTAIA